MSAETYATARQRCVDFAARHGLTFEESGSIGFGRDCVGFSRNGCYIEIEPCQHKPGPGFEYETVPGTALAPGMRSAIDPDDVAPNAYHKVDCLAVLVGDGRWSPRTVATIAGGDPSAFDEEPPPDIAAVQAAVIELAAWVAKIEAAGNVRIVEYDGIVEYDASRSISTFHLTAHAIVVEPHG